MAAKSEDADMMKTINQKTGTHASLTAYGLAAAALGIISLPAGAAEQAIDGLPISIGDGLPSVDLDFDGDLVDDIRVYRTQAYGGGFAIAALQTGDSAHRIKGHFVRADTATYYVGYVQRHDGGEIVSENGYYYSVNGFNPDVDIYHEGNSSTSDTYRMMTMDMTGSQFTPYTPFRNKPGFVGIMLRGDSGTGGVSVLPYHIAWLEVVVSPDGSELKILSGAWDDQNYSNHLVLPPVTPPPAGLADLALGSE